MKRYIKTSRDYDYSDEPYYWEAIAELSDGSELRFTRPYNENMNDDEQQYRIEEELLQKAVGTGKEVVFYTVNFVNTRY